MFSLALFVMFIPIFWQEGKMVVLPTKDPDVFNIIYEADMKWNIIVKLYDERGKKRFDTEIQNSERFILPINLKGESSGKYSVEISTPAYDLRKELDYLTSEDQLATRIGVEYITDKHTIRVQTQEIIDLPFTVYIYNEQGDRLVTDEIEPRGMLINRSYNLKGAPASRFEFIILTSGNIIKKEFFTY